MDFLSKIFRSTTGLDGRDYSNSGNRPESFFFEGRDDDKIPQPDELFSFFDQAFANFHRVFANPGSVLDNLPDSELESGLDFNSRSGSLGDQMLKQPDSDLGAWRDQIQIVAPENETKQSPYFFDRFWNRKKPYWNRAITEKLDTDLDDIVKTEGLDAILGRSENVSPPSRISPPSGGYNSGFSRVSVNTRRTADGKLEEHRTMIDSQGNETTVVTRSVDGKTFKQTTTKKRSGEVEVKEDWSNVKTEDQAEFKQNWNLFSTPKLDAPPAPGLLREYTDDQTQSIFEKLFGSKGQK